MKFLELRKYTKASLTAELEAITNNAAQDSDLQELNEEGLESIIDKEDQARTEFLTPLFEGLEVFSLFPTENTVYPRNDEERKEVIDALLSIGFENIHTYIPQVSDGQKGSKKDPARSLAVNFSASENLIFGQHSDKFLRILTPIIKDELDKAIYTYCYNSDCRLTFRDKDAATTLYRKLKVLMASNMDKLANLELSVNIKEKGLDNLTVQIKLVV